MKEENDRMELVAPTIKVNSKSPKVWIPGMLMLSSLGIVLAVALVLLLSGVYFSAGEEVSGVYRPEGYYKRVREMLNEKGLVYRPPTQVEQEAGNTWGKIDLEDSATKNKYTTFYEESRRLREDLKDFNEGGPGGLLLFSDNKLGVSRWAHNFSLPYPQRVGYGGRLSFQGEDMPTLASQSLNLAFVRSDTPPNRIPASDIRVLQAQEWLTNERGETFRAKGFELHHPKGFGRVLALKVDGEKVRLETPEGTFSIKVLLNGVPLNRQGQTDAEREAFERVRARQEGLPSNEYLLEQGDRLLVRLEGRELVFRFGKLSGGLITRNWMSNGRTISRVDAGVAREIPYLKSLHSALNSYIGASDKPERIANTPAVISLDRVLHRDLQEDLEDFLAVFDTRYSAEANIEKEPACVTVMDALTGEILALPSYPSAEKLDQLQEVDLARRTARMSNREKQRLALNQNLLRSPVGSTTKPMFALAIWDQYPRLRKLTVTEPSVNVSEVVTYRFFERPVGTYARNNPGLTRVVDPADFLTLSSNTYTLSLYLLSLAKPESFRIDSRGYAQAVDRSKGIDFSDYIKGNVMPGSLNRQHAGNEKLESLFDVNLVSNQAGSELDSLSPQLLRPLFQKLEIPEGRVPREFRGLVCEETNFALQTVDTVRGELVALLLGGGTNFWSNAKLAECFARIGTGKRVEMSLVKSDQQEPQFPLLDVDAEALALVQRGLAGSTSRIGTARNLADAVAEQRRIFASKGLEFRLLGKTGTGRRKEGRECAAYVCYAEVVPRGSKKPLAAVVMSTYLQDRAHVRDRTLGSASGVAVKLTEEMLPKIGDWLANHPEVVEFEKKSK